MIVLEQKGHEHRADVPGTAGDEEMHQRRAYHEEAGVEQ
jgi:hypothetical protein